METIKSYSKMKPTPSPSQEGNGAVFNLQLAQNSN